MATGRTAAPADAVAASAVTLRNCLRLEREEIISEIELYHGESKNVGEDADVAA